MIEYYAKNQERYHLIYLDVRAYLKRVFDYKLKASVLKTDLCKQVKKINKAEYLKYAYGIVDHSAEMLYFDALMVYGPKWIEQANKINNANYKRIERLKARIDRYLNNGICTWITLTFRNDILESTNEKTRRKYVSLFLKKIAKSYVANIDFGVDDRYTKREHYHALCVGDIRHVQTLEWQNSYGYTFVETVRRGNDVICIAKYISKLTNHAIKESTKQCRYIYSRG